MGRDISLIVLLVAAVALLWWVMQWTGRYRCTQLLVELERWTFGEGKAPIGDDLQILLEVLSDAMPLRDWDTARILRRARPMTLIRTAMLVSAARQGAVTEAAATLLDRAIGILEAGARNSGTPHGAELDGRAVAGGTP